MDTFELRAPGVRLASPTEADIDRIAELCQDPEVQRWTTMPSPYTHADAESFVGDMVPSGWERGGPTWGIRVPHADGERLVGMVGVDSRELRSAEIGYWLAPDARGRGLMHQAVGLALDAAFGQLDLERVEWRATVGNWPSWRVVWRHGFRKEGAVRGLGIQRGMRTDQWIGTLLAGDPREPAAPWDGPTA
ncbi:GNAT family N-acetyltransferase [Georgenia faecalis]|uniref:GNAT family N-acetyltransferase n=1 Tax=Georgenia faecalis TaxID=2483799 RepID=UPI000FD93FDF|nr:GNAT family N-acetyltransferase [Georgenia faecalis]